MFPAVEDSIDFEYLTLPTGFCSECLEEVLAYARLGRESSESLLVWRCLFCDNELGRGDDVVRYETVSDLRTLGLSIDQRGEEDTCLCSSCPSRRNWGTGTDEG